jgi:ribose 1,5-bisphosphate isomerase
MNYILNLKMTKLIPEVKLIARDIQSMKIRGAGRIARAAAKALMLTAINSEARNVPAYLKEMEGTTQLLLSTRPTAVSLPNSVKFIMKRVVEAKDSVNDVDEIRLITRKIAESFIKESKEAVKKIGEIGAKRISKGDTLLTHCNSQAAIEIIKTAWDQKKKVKVFATETRPRFQGRETAKILSDKGIPITMVVDSAVRYVMNEVDKVIVGADAVAANGAVVNKIGTSTIALVAKEARTPFFVATETYKFDPDTTLGEVVTIEERDPSEVISKRDMRKLKNVKVFNPAFDVTPPEYIDFIITEKGIIPPQAAISVIQQEFGWMLFERTERRNIIEED